MEPQTYYEPSDRCFEARVRERIDYWKQRRKEMATNSRKPG
jgi:putative ATPase